MLSDFGTMLAVLAAIAVFGAAFLFLTAWLPFSLLDWLSAWLLRRARREGTRLVRWAVIAP